MCSIDIEPCNQAHRHLRQALRDAEQVIMDEIEGDDDEYEEEPRAGLAYEYP